MIRLTLNKDSVMTRLTLAAGALALAVSGCSAAQQANLANMLTVACEKDGQYQPIALTVLQVAGAGIAPVGQAASLDAALVHPAVVAFCTQYAAKPAVVPVTVAPAAVVPVAASAPMVAPAKP